MGTERVLAAGLWVLLAGCATRWTDLRAVEAMVDPSLDAEVRWVGLDRALALDAAGLDLLAAPLDADAAARVALLRNPGLQAAFDELGVARARVLATGSLPDLALEARFNVVGDEGPLESGAATVDLVELVTLPLRRDAAANAVRAARVRAARAVLELDHAARVALLDVQHAEATLEQERVQLVAASGTSDLADRLFEAGNITEYERSLERILHEEARLGVARAERRALLARERVNALLALSGPDAARWTAAPGPPPVPAGPVAPDPELEARAVEASLELAEARARRAEAARDLDVARWGALVPRVGVGVGVERDGADLETGPVVSVSVPIGGSSFGRTRAARGELGAATHRIEAEAVEVRARARGARDWLVEAHRAALLHETSLVPWHEQALVQAQLQYNAMGLGVFQLLEARRARADAERARLDARLDYWRARAAVDLARAGGHVDVPFDGEPMEPGREEGQR
ncbi:MAG: TolC family protein [Myxococcota bacterium]